MAKIVVNTGRGPQEIEATVIEGLAVHRAVCPWERDRWTITHRTSGRALAWAHTRREALELAGRLLPLASWELEEAGLEAAISDATREEIAALCREYKRPRAVVEG